MLHMYPEVLYQCKICCQKKKNFPFNMATIYYILYKQHERDKVISVGVHMFVDKKKLNHTLAIDSSFQTIAVRLLVKFID